MNKIGILGKGSGKGGIDQGKIDVFFSFFPFFLIFSFFFLIFSFFFLIFLIFFSFFLIFFLIFPYFLDAHCQQQWASLGVEFSGKKKEVEKLMGDHGRSMGGHGRSVGVMGGQWGVLRGQWGVMGGQWVVLGGQWEVKGGSRQVTRRLQNAHCQRYSRAEALPVIFWLRYLSKIWVKSE